jgi:hypothetical protein
MDQDEVKPKRSIFKKWWFWGIIIVLFVFVILISASGGSSKPSEKYKNVSAEEVKQSAVENLSYEELFRNNSKYVGKVVHYVGKIVQTQENSNNNYTIRANVTEKEYGSWEDDVFLNYEGERILEDEIVEFWGEVKGVRKYETVLGASRSIPEITVLRLEVLKNYLGGGTTPIKKTVEVGKTDTQNGFSVTLDKIEITDKQTRAWLTVKNDSKYKMSFYTYSAKLVQGEKQLEKEDVFEQQQELPSEFLPNVEAKGVIVFPAINEIGSVRLVVDKPYAQDMPFEEYSTANFKEVAFEVEL